MIAAGVLPACPAAWQRGVHALVSAGVWVDIPLAAIVPSHVWLAIPAALVTCAAVAAAVWSGPRAVVMTAALSAFVHPWLPLALAPLALAARPWPEWQQWRWLLAAAGTAAAVALLVTPECRAFQAPVGWRDLAVQALGGLGPAGIALAIFDLAFAHDARRQQVAILSVALVAGALAVTALMDATATQGAMLAVCWWRAASGGRRMLRWQASTGARAGAMLILAAVPVLAVEPLARSAPGDDGPATETVWRALDGIRPPAAVISTGGHADVATAIWQAGRRGPVREPLLVPSPDGPAALTGRALYAWPHTAGPLRVRGFTLGPLGTDTPDVFRVLDAVPCQPLTTAWADVGEQAAAAQVTGVFPEVAPLRGVLLYVTGENPPTPRPIGWPPEAIGGFEARAFDRQTPGGSAALAEALDRDAMNAGVLGSARFAARVRFDRRASAPETLRVGFGAALDAAWARRYALDDVPEERQPALCRDTSGQVVAAFEGAAPVMALDLSSPQVAGRGWQRTEGSGLLLAGPEADLFYLAGQPRPLRLQLDAEPDGGEWASIAVRVTLNGVASPCLDGVTPCDWLLPAAGMRRGLNVVTIHVSGLAPATTPRRLIVRGARLINVRLAG